METVALRVFLPWYSCHVITKELAAAVRIGILDFTLFPEHPEFYATNKMMNVQKHYIYNDKFTLNVLDLNHTELATDEDKQWKLDYWARQFKAET